MVNLLIYCELCKCRLECLYANLVIRGVIFLDSIGHVERDVAIRKVPLGETIRKDTLLLPIGINVFHRVIRKVDFFGAIRIVLLTLLTMHAIADDIMFM